MRRWAICSSTMPAPAERCWSRWRRSPGRRFLKRSAPGLAGRRTARRAPAAERSLVNGGSTKLLEQPGADAVQLPCPLIGTEEEPLIFDDRSANSVRRTDSRATNPWAAGAVEEEVVRVQVFIAKEFEQRAVKLIGAALGDDVHIGARIPAVRRVILAGLNLEFLNGVRIGNRDASAEIAAALKIVDGRLRPSDSCCFSWFRRRMRSCFRLPPRGPAALALVTSAATPAFNPMICV